MPQFGKQLNADAEGEVSRGQRRILIGYSMGGRLALHALLEGGPWHAAVIISANPGIRDAGEVSSKRSQDTVWATRALTQSWAEFLNDWNAQPILGGAMRDEREDKKLIQRRREIARSFVDWSAGNQQSLWSRLSEIKVPVLWVAGENDPKYVAIAKEAASGSDGFRVEIAPDSGHRVPWDKEAWLVERIHSFIS